jgi:hypothetical protein
MNNWMDCLRAESLESNSDIELGRHTNFLGKIWLKVSSCEKPLAVYVVYTDKDGNGIAEGQFFVVTHKAYQLFRAVQSNPKAWDNPELKGYTGGQLEDWLLSLGEYQLKMLTDPAAIAEEGVIMEIAGIQVVGSNQSFRRLEMLAEDARGERYTENHDGYYCLRVYLHDHCDDESAFIFVKDKANLHPVMEELLNTWVDVRLEISNPDQLTELLA